MLSLTIIGAFSTTTTTATILQTDHSIVFAWWRPCVAYLIPDSLDPVLKVYVHIDKDRIAV